MYAFAPTPPIVHISPHNLSMNVADWCWVRMSCHVDPPELSGTTTLDGICARALDAIPNQNHSAKWVFFRDENLSGDISDNRTLALLLSE